MTYQIVYLETVVTDDIPALPTRTKTQIKKAIEERLMTDPVSFGKPLQYSWKGHRRLRVGDYRVVYRIEENKVVVVVAIRHRKNVYED